jgi:hypothetical protein
MRRRRDGSTDGLVPKDNLLAAEKDDPPMFRARERDDTKENGGGSTAKWC